MNKIEVYRTHIIINNYNQGDCQSLENCFRIFDPTNHTFIYQAIDYLEDERKLILPRGIDIPYLENRFRCKATYVETFDKYQVFPDIQIKYFPRDDIQREALKFMLGVEKYERNKYLSQLSVNLNTGKGKSYCSICTAAYTGIKSIIITYSTKWLQQWKEFIMEYTNTKESEICMMINSSKIARTLKEDPSKYKFILTSHSSLVSYAKNNGWESIGEMFKKLEIGIKFFDEAHLNFSSMSMIDFYTNTFKTYYITATPMRSDKDENKIYQLYMKNVPSIDLFDADNDPHTDYMALKYNSCPEVEVLNACKNKYGLNRNAYINYIVTNENFYKILRVIMNMIINKGGKTLIYIGTINAINIIYQWIITNYPEFSFNTCILTSETEDKTIVDRNQIILSTTKSAGAAMDIPNLKRTVVLAEPFKSEVLARQTLGRTRNNNTEYIEVVDIGFRSIVKWFTYKKQIFKKYASSYNVINISNEELDTMYYDIMIEREKLILPVPQYKHVIRYNYINPIIYHYKDDVDSND